MLSICMHRRGVMTKTFTSTNISHNTVKICVLTRALGFTKLNSIVIYELQITYPRLELICRPYGCIEEACYQNFLYNLYITQYKHNMCPDEEFIDLAVTELRSVIRTTDDTIGV